MTPHLDLGFALSGCRVDQRTTNAEKLGDVLGFIDDGPPHSVYGGQMSWRPVNREPSAPGSSPAWRNLGEEQRVFVLWEIELGELRVQVNMDLAEQVRRGFAKIVDTDGEEVHVVVCRVPDVIEGCVGLEVGGTLLDELQAGVPDVDFEWVGAVELVG
jgi:hypothetical protein